LVLRRGIDAWSVVGTVASDGRGKLSFEDLSVAPGTRYEYRLSFNHQAESAQAFGQVSVETPAAPRFALLGAFPNPTIASDRLSVRYSLATREQATLEVVDVQGRTVWRRTLPAVEPGNQSILIDSSTRLSPGIYFLRLEQGGNTATRRLVIVD
jgi:hypothetical protein